MDELIEQIKEKYQAKLDEIQSVEKLLSEKTYELRETQKTVVKLQDKLAEYEKKMGALKKAVGDLQ